MDRSNNFPACVITGIFFSAEKRIEITAENAEVDQPIIGGKLKRNVLKILKAIGFSSIEYTTSNSVSQDGNIIILGLGIASYFDFFVGL